jgi:hypothetical protein
LQRIFPGPAEVESFRQRTLELDYLRDRISGTHEQWGKAADPLVQADREAIRRNLSESLSGISS